MPAFEERILTRAVAGIGLATTTGQREQMTPHRKQPAAGIDETRTIARIERSIHRVRGQNVMLDADLAALYGVETKALVRPSSGIVRVFPPTL